VFAVDNADGVSAGNSSLLVDNVAVRNLAPSSSATTSATASQTGSLSFGATPTPSATSSSVPRAVTLELSVPGRASLLLIDDFAGLSREFRQAIANAVGFDSSRVLITAVQEQVLAPNGTLESSDQSIALNSTVPANNGTLAQPNASLVWATPTAQPAAARALQQSSAPLSADAACVTYRSFNVSNSTRTRVSLAVDVTGLVWVNNTDPAAHIAALLARALDMPNTLLNFTRQWTECTGASATSGVTVLQAPAVRTGLRPSPSQSAPLAIAANDGTQQEYSGLGKGGLTALLVGLLFSAFACVMWGAWALRACQRQPAASDMKGEHNAEAAALSRGDLAAAAISEAVCRPRATAPAVSSV